MELIEFKTKRETQNKAQKNKENQTLFESKKQRR